MRYFNRTSVGLVATTLAAASALSLTTATPASAGVCRGPKYPTGGCDVFFAKTVYYPGDTVKFVSDNAFQAHEKVDGTLRCANNFHRAEGPWTTGRRGRASGQFVLPRHTPVGTCTLRLTGRRSGAHAHGSFTAKHHHHHG